MAQRILSNPNYIPGRGHWETLYGELKSCQPGSDAYRTIEAAMKLAERAKGRSNPKKGRSSFYRHDYLGKAYG